MTNFDCILSLCVFFFVLILARVITRPLGWVIIAMLILLYYLAENGYFGGRR